MNIEHIFEPNSIAVVGASQAKGKIGYESMANASLYEGRVHPVNPSASGTLFGQKFSESVADVDDDVDLALVCVPASIVPDVIDDCAEAGVGGAVIHAGGFAEAGTEEGIELQAEITEKARKHDISLLGPNTSGFCRPGMDLFATFAAGVEKIPPGEVAILAQSGGLAHQIGFHAQREGRGMSAMLGLGNRSNVGFKELIEYFDEDSSTRAIVLHVEGTDDRDALMRACRRAETPIVAFKIGKTDVNQFADNHTGADIGDYETYIEDFEEAGVQTVDSSIDLFDVGTTLAKSTIPDRLNIGVVTAQAGPGIIISDRIQRTGATLPDLSDETHERIEEILAGITYTDNPVDTGRPMPEFGDVVEAVANDDQVDIVLVYELFEEALGLPVESIENITERHDKPLVFATEGPVEDMADDVQAIREAGVPVFTSPERGVEAALAIVGQAEIADRDH